MDILNTLKRMKKADNRTEEIKNTPKPSKLTDKQKYLRSLRGRF